MSKIYGIIYKVTNKINGKCYVGQTTQTLNDRKKGHKYCSIKINKDDYFHNAIRKYGWKNFKWEVLCKCENKDILNIRETMKIIVNLSHWTEGKGYNLTWGGDGCAGLKQTAEHIKKRVNTTRERGGYIWNDERKRKHSKIRKGKKCTIEQIKKISETLTGHTVSEETKQKMSISHMGYIRTKEHQDKLNESNKGSRKYLIDDILKAFEMRKEGLSQYKIAEIMNLSRTTIQYWFKNGEKHYVYKT